MGKTLCAATATLLLMTMRTSAHHAFAAEYDENRRVTVSGTVTNPMDESARVVVRRWKG